MSSCGIHHGLTTNANVNTTKVELSENNFEIIESVQGKSEALYVFGIGGFSKEAMIAEARADMLRRPDMIGSSKAVINETVEISHTLFPVVRLYKVTVSGHLIEFTH